MKQYSKLLERIMKKYNLSEHMKIDLKLLKKISRKEHIELKDLCYLLQIETVTLNTLKNGKQKYTKLNFNRYKKYEDNELIEKGTINKKQFIEIKEKQGIKTYRLARKLGISMYRYYKMLRDENLEVKVIDIEKKRIAELILMDLKYLRKQRAGYFTKQELEETCEKRNMNLDEFLKYYSKNEKHYILNKLILEESKKGLWIGSKRKISTNFFNINGEKLYQGVRNVAYRYAFLYKWKPYIEDLVQDAMLEISEKCGDVVKKFYFDSKLLFNVLMVKARFMMLKYYYKKYKSKETSYNQWENSYLDHSKILSDRRYEPLYDY